MGIFQNRYYARITTMDRFVVKGEVGSWHETFRQLLNETKNIEYKAAELVCPDTGEIMLAMRTIR